MVALTLGAAIVTAAVAHSPQWPRTSAPPRTAGVAVMALGLAVRVWAVAALGAGFGVARGAWLSSAVSAFLLVPALVRRIHVEEAELDRVLGEAYRTYRCTTTARLIPRLW